MIIQVTVGDNTRRDTRGYDDTRTLRSIFEENSINYTSPGVVNSLDCCPLRPGDLDKTLADFGIQNKVVLSSVVKADNA